jgi:hypothetical protein
MCNVILLRVQRVKMDRVRKKTVILNLWLLKLFVADGLKIDKLWNNYK